MSCLKSGSQNAILTLPTSLRFSRKYKVMNANHSFYNLRKSSLEIFEAIL